MAAMMEVEYNKMLGNGKEPYAYILSMVGIPAGTVGRNMYWDSVWVRFDRDQGETVLSMQSSLGQLSVRG